jgi:hypothetical protein
MKIVGLFVLRFAEPLIKPIGGDQASTLLEGSSKGGF